MIGSMIGRISTAEKMSVDQLREALENKTLPAYIAIPLLQEKMDMEQRMRAAVTGRSQMPEQPPLADEVMLRAQNERGITSLPSHMVPNMAGGGIVALSGGGETNNRRINPRTGQPYTDAEMASGLHHADARETIAKNAKGVWGSVKSGIADLFSGPETPPTEEELAERARLDRLGILKPFAAAGDVLAGGPYNAVVQPAANWLLGSRLGQALGAGDARLPPVGSGSATPYYDMLREAAASPPDAKSAPTGEPAPTGESDAQMGQPAPEAAQRGVPNQGIAAIPTKPSGTQPTTQPATPQEAKPSAMQKYVDLLMEDRESAKGERNDAKWMALLQAGLATMSGTSPYALQNLGQGASVGLQAYNAAVSDLSKREREALEKALAAEAAIEDMGLKREQFESEKEYRAGMLDLKKQELGIMAAKAAAAATASTGIKPKDRATLVINLTKTYMEQGMSQAEAARAAQDEVDYLLGITPQHTDSGKPDPRLAGGARMFKYPTQ